jgi:hypothetical protein
MRLQDNAGRALWMRLTALGPACLSRSVRRHYAMQLSRGQKQIAVTLFALMVLAAGVALYVLRPSSPAGRFPRDFSEAEQREICTVVHKDGLRRSFSALSRGQFSTAWRAVRYTKRQSVYRVRSQTSGGIWVMRSQSLFHPRPWFRIFLSYDR